MRVVLLSLLLLSFALPAVHGRVLGVQTAHVGLYDAAESSKSFRCLDESKTIPFSAVNDEVCDCPDGSDEPGTSACAALINGVLPKLPENWQFQCTNEGFFEQSFPHSRVSDGICDCCDGSDELLSDVTCPNRCAEVEGERAQQMEEEMERMKLALVNKSAMRDEAMKLRGQRAESLIERKKARDTILAELPALEDRYNELQKAPKPVREELRAKLEKLEASSNEGEAFADSGLENLEDPDSYTAEAKAAQQILVSRRSKLEEIEKNIEELTKFLNSTTPLTEELLRTLEGKEFSMEFQDYTYTVSMFKKVFRKSKDSFSDEVLGWWKSFAENTYSLWSADAYDLTQMRYDNGNRCWNGVIRSVDIQLVCGVENRLTHIEEPTMCVYRMVFETPAMCKE
ncbi:hypothetical protein ABL78_3693 [Leptomonas seymouri]|uniref:Glucosidase 2 subunit beta n=1 Tax=Leptomonas seymouri TaxID=5684 RepID=A0A0N1HXK5_LEPSE|nr:hypothetical protein ABL78_3693 [Leptomonas seymouri]|eukprot:KPI87223.1 hypothetical protein ABL78_3693 [Leptomonas seymouri]